MKKTRPEAEFGGIFAVPLLGLVERDEGHERKKEVTVVLLKTKISQRNAV